MTDESGGLLALVLVADELPPLCVVSVELLPLPVVSDGLLTPALALPVVCGVVLQGGGLYPPR
jgi:hypothetical protein